MSRRRRWRNVKGRASRAPGPGERLLAAGGSAAAFLTAPFLPGAGASPPQDVLVLRLDRIGDVLMSLPALRALREALPTARIRLAVGEWSRGVAANAAVDEVLVWSAPWVGRADEGASSLPQIFATARALRSSPPDLALDLQGDLRALWLMAATGARARVGYANTGSAALLTRVVDLDEDINFVEQNYRAVEAALGNPVPRRPFVWLDESRRGQGREWLAAALREAGIERTGPLVGMHPGAGRRIKEWPVERFAELAGRLHRQRGATLVLTGSASERARTATMAAAVPGRALDLAGRLDLAQFAEVMGACDAFVSGDTSAMHFAAALGVPSVAIFGPSDPSRYFSGGPQGFASGARHLVVKADLWCRPCNLIRRPPAECDARPAPECLTAISTDTVFAALVEVLDDPRLPAGDPTTGSIE